MKLYKEFLNVEMLNNFILNNKLIDYNVQIFKCRDDKLHQSDFIKVPDSVIAKEKIVYVLEYKVGE